MNNLGYLLIIAIFVIYYLAVLVIEKKLIYDPKDIIRKFLSVVLVYAGFSLIYFSLTGKPLFTENPNEYYIYIFIIGFIALLWAVPTLLLEFRFFKKFIKNKKDIEK